MTIGSVISKDLKVYVRHRKTVLLIFLAPVLIMILIGSVFSGSSGESLKDVKLGVGGGSKLGEEIIEELNNSAIFIIVKVNTTDPGVIENGVKQGKYSAGIFIPTNETQSMKLYIDNSRVQIAPVISTVFLTITEKMSYELTLGFISRLWENLAQMESELDPLKESVLIINNSITDLNSNTRDVMVSLNEINVSDLKNSVGKMKYTMNQMNTDLNRSANDISITRKELQDLDSKVSSISNNSAELRDQLKVVIDSIDLTDNALKDVQKGLQDTFDIICINPQTEECKSISKTIQQIQDTRSLIRNRTDPIRSLHSSLENVAQTGSDLHEKLNQTDIRLKNMQESINNYTLEMSNIQGNITNIENAVVTLDYVKNQSTVISEHLEKLNTEIVNKTPGLIDGIDRTKNILKEVISRSPAAVAAPIKLERERVFKDRSYLDFLMPAIISIVLMFISFFLASITIVQERAKKTLVRTLLTPLSLEEFIIAKTSALIFIAMLEGIILIIVAFLLYGVVIPVDRLGELFLTVLVYSASFIGIGMAVATFAESENTAMLSTLVLSIPMLFLCGVFFPFETMPPLMVSLGSSLPITVGIKALDSVLIYQQGSGTLAGYLLLLLLYGIAGLGLAYILLRKEMAD